MKQLAPFLSLCLLACPVKADQLSALQSGNWIGTGLMRTAPTSAVIKGKCKITIKPTTDVLGRKVSGKCSSPAGASQIIIRIEKRQGDQLAAFVATKANNTSVQLLGHVKNGNIILWSREPQKIKSVEYNSALTISPLDNSSFTLKQFITPLGSDNQINVVDMTFIKAN